jgi:hypothetical protein
MVRRLTVFGLVTVGHLILSGFGVLLMIAAGMGGRGDWLIAAVGFTLFFPALAASALGADLDIDTLPAGLVVAGFVANSLCWALVVCPVWACLRRWALARKSRAEAARRREEEAAWWEDFFRWQQSQ